MPHTPEPSLAGELLRNARWLAGLTQAEVAQRAGVTQQTIAQYERGRRQPSLMTLAQLVSGCGVSLQWSLSPEPGLADVPTIELLARDPADRVGGDLLAAMHDLTACDNAPAFLFSGKLAARLQRADLRAYELEVWIGPSGSRAELSRWLDRAGVKYVDPDGDVCDADIALSPDGLRYGRPFVSRTADLRIRSVDFFSEIRGRAAHVHLSGSTSTSPIAAIQDCCRYWPDRDLDRLAVQRAVRLAGGRQAIREALLGRSHPG